MSRHIMNDMVYDTKKAKKICSGYKREPVTLFGAKTGYSHNAPVDLYRTKKGNYFCIHTQDFDRGEILSVEDAKSIMKQYAYNEFCKLYGALPEA